MVLKSFFNAYCQRSNAPPVGSPHHSRLCFLMKIIRVTFHCLLEISHLVYWESAKQCMRSKLFNNPRQHKPRHINLVLLSSSLQGVSLALSLLSFLSLCSTYYLEGTSLLQSPLWRARQTAEPRPFHSQSPKKALLQGWMLPVVKNASCAAYLERCGFPIVTSPVSLLFTGKLVFVRVMQGLSKGNPRLRALGFLKLSDHDLL